MSLKWAAATLLAAAMLPVNPCVSASKEKAPKALHGKPWAFGQSNARADAIWHTGLDGKEVTKNALPDQKPDAANTKGGINNALENASKKNLRGNVGLSMGNETSSWKVTPEQKNIHPDETIFRERSHVVRAFADVKAGENLNISVGPELIIKDEKHAEESANESQPDSSLGVGMKFKLDF